MRVEILLAIALCTVTVASRGCYKPSGHKSPYTWTPNQLNGPIPDTFSWGDVNGVNYLTQMKNQHIPQYCGSCWAQGTTSALSDRIAIMRKAAFPEINISPQVLLDCDMVDDGCDGGDHSTAYAYIHDNSITDETCAPYRAISHFMNKTTCTAQSICNECQPSGKCAVPKRVFTYTINEYANITGEAAMMNEIYARGPIACVVNADPILNYTGFGVFSSDNQDESNHIISVAGWGVENGVKYWLLRNSWGEYWGYQGYAKIERGVNTIQIESSCAYAVPVDTWSGQVVPITLKQAAADARGEKTAQVKEKIEEKAKEIIENGVDYLITEIPRLKELIESLYRVIFPQSRRHSTCLFNTGRRDYPELPVEGIQISPLPEDYLSLEDVPAKFWWGDVDGTNYLSWTVDQHLPVYCGSCWAQAAISALADRLNIATKNAFPKRALSVQMILNCQPDGGSCHGGQLDSVYRYGNKNYLVEVGCQIYTATDPQKAECSPIQICKNCKPNDDFTESICWAQPTYPKWKVNEWGRVKGPDAMKKEIFARGPISCGMHVTDKFEGYMGGIYEQETLFPVANHAVSVVGWGNEQGTEYWIVRNSWGTHWGENGYFRISMHKGNLGIGINECYWAMAQEM